MSEQALVSSILQYLELKSHYVWRNNTGMLRRQDKDGRWHFYKMGKKGAADIIGCSVDGRMIAIECKMPGKKPTEDQEIFLQEVRTRGGYGILAYSIDDVLAVF